MSKIGFKTIRIPENVSVSLENSIINTKGEKGQLDFEIPRNIVVEINDSSINVTRKNDSKTIKALHGLTRSIISNNIIGVLSGFSKTLQVIGIGYRVAMENNQIVLNVGFSHPVKIDIPSELQVSVNKNDICISGIDKQLVGNFSARIRSIKPPEPYKGKGIRYSDEIIKKKAGKAAKAAGAK
ncbi:MAG: LSU ribosomal protein L6P [Candidatus Berkelbacteria bacterium Licking1014_85]|uniref:Large ribosomal subunit protein uL6 n=1 Tax=Candidatus Berkelbacteria bacterium Licking1014_85 TaxID=2017148 RepID=A0A554LMR1_9BACT|nr:MAG: LSU ribosomal protein L6P [Candidatus Berkelbacteria bacterium Licking1014_85]